VKDAVKLGPKGVRALAALCHHVSGHGTFARDGRRIAQILLAVCDAEEDSAAWDALDRGRPACPHSAARLRDALAALTEKPASPQGEAPPEPKGGA